MNKYSLFSIALLFATIVSAQDYKKEYSELLTKKDTAKLILHLQQWEKAAPDDPEVYIAYFNHYFRKSKKEIMQLVSGAPPKPGSFVLTDSTGNQAGYIGDTTIYEPASLEKCFYYINKGIAKHPARLDMRFGKIFVLGETGDYKTFTEELIKTLHYSNTIGNKWFWAENKPMEDPKKTVLGAVQDYIVTLYETNDDALLDNMRAIAETVLKYYPDHVPSLSNIAVTYTLQGNNEKALETFRKAEKIAPTDFVILNNIANIYRIQKDKPNAIRYYELVLKHGDERAKETATKQLEILRN